MGCTSCKSDQTIDSTKDARNIIKQKYKIEATLLGDGVFGKVFLATQKEKQIKVAIKGKHTHTWFTTQPNPCFPPYHNYKNTIPKGDFW